MAMMDDKGAEEVVGGMDLPEEDSGGTGQPKRVM